MFFKKRNKKKAINVKDIRTVTDLFVWTHEHICNFLRSVSTGKNPLTGAKSSKDLPKFKKASKFEIGLYLIFRMDQLATSYKQSPEVRYKITDSCFKTFLPYADPCFDKIYDHRLQTYGNIFNEIKNSGGDWADVWSTCGDWLLNAIYYSRDDYRKLTTENMPLVLLGFTQTIGIKIALQECEIHTLAMFGHALKNVFSDNNNYLSLSEEEVTNRIRTGLAEGAKTAQEVNQKHSKNKKLNDDQKQ